MSETARKFGVYRKIFGLRGFWLAIKTRLAMSPYEEMVEAPGGPIFLRLKTSDLNAYDKVFLSRDYEFPVARLPRVIIDAGANLGFAAIYFARKFPQARIFAIEPERSNFDLMQRNARPYPNITPIRGALWNEDGTMQLADRGLGHWAFHVVSEKEAAGTRTVEQVPTFTMPTLMRRHGIDYIDILKVDIEGSEKELFETAPGWIDRVGSIMIELHDRWKPGCTETFINATKDFPVETSRGENVYRGRHPFPNREKVPVQA